MLNNNFLSQSREGIFLDSLQRVIDEEENNLNIMNQIKFYNENINNYNKIIEYIEKTIKLDLNLELVLVGELKRLESEIKFDWFAELIKKKNEEDINPRNFLYELICEASCRFEKFETDGNLGDETEGRISQGMMILFRAYLPVGLNTKFRNANTFKDALQKANFMALYNHKYRAGIANRDELAGRMVFILSALFSRFNNDLNIINFNDIDNVLRNITFDIEDPLLDNIQYRNKLRAILILTRDYFIEPNRNFNNLYYPPYPFSIKWFDLDREDIDLNNLPLGEILIRAIKRFYDFTNVKPLQQSIADVISIIRIYRNYYELNAPPNIDGIHIIMDQKIKSLYIKTLFL